MVWTNAVGAVFSAALLSVDRQGVTFVFPEDGATNTIAFASLSKESVDAACELAGYERLDETEAALRRHVQRELRRIDDLVASGAISPEEAEEKRRNILKAFNSRRKRLGS